MISLAILKYLFLCQSSLLHVLLHKPVALSCWNVKSSRVILDLYPLVVMFSFHSFFLLALSYNVQIDKTLNLSIPQRIDFLLKRMLERRSYSQLKNDLNKWSIQEQMRLYFILRCISYAYLSLFRTAMHVLSRGTVICCTLNQLLYVRM